MRALAVARADFDNVSRSYLVRGVIAVLAVIVVGIVVLPELLASFGARLAFEVTSQASGQLVPIIALVTGYLSVAGERESGTVRVLLSLPPSRRDVVLGKFIARAGIVLAGILLAYALGSVGSLLVYGSLPLDAVVGTTLLTCLLGVTFVGIAVALSAATASRARAVTAAVGFYVFTVVLWDILLLGAQFLLEIREPIPEWFRFLQVFPPSSAFGRLYNSLVGSLLSSGPPPGDAVYLSDPAMVLLLLAWLVVPLVLGYWRFARANLS